VSPDIPWHVTAFHADYKMTDPPNTTAEMLLAAVEIGAGSGLRYIYPGNLPGQVGHFEDTRCAVCGETLIGRYGYLVREYRLTPDGRCPSCAMPVPGRWDDRFSGQVSARPFVPRSRTRLALHRM
jgi:pyruvate formate lyase activating enzyme